MKAPYCWPFVTVDSPHKRRVIRKTFTCHDVTMVIYYLISVRTTGRRSEKTLKLRVTGLVWGIHRWPMNSPHKRPVTRKRFPFDDVTMYYLISVRTARVYRRLEPWCDVNDEPLIMVLAIRVPFHVGTAQIYLVDTWITKMSIRFNLEKPNSWLLESKFGSFALNLNATLDPWAISIVAPTMEPLLYQGSMPPGLPHSLKAADLYKDNFLFWMSVNLSGALDCFTDGFRSPMSAFCKNVNTHWTRAFYSNSFQI